MVLLVFIRVDKMRKGLRLPKLVSFQIILSFYWKTNYVLVVRLAKVGY
jgi:hypothetical protein